MIYFLDTNIFLRVLNKKDNLTAHLESTDLLKDIKQRKIKAVTSNIVLSEIVWTMQRFYEFPKEEIVLALNSIYNLSISMNDNFQTARAIKLFKTMNVKFVDCLIASIPQIHECKWTIVSYDKDFDKLGVIRKEPKEVTRGLN